MRIFDKWKKEWWVIKSSELYKEFEQKKIELENTLNQEIKFHIQKLEIERDILYAKVKSEIEKGKLLEEEVAYRIKTLENRKLELIQTDNDTKRQISILEAKASPTAVWAEAFTAGATKTWELIVPVMTDNLSILKTKMKEEAVQEAIARFNAPNKK